MDTLLWLINHVGAAKKRDIQLACLMYREDLTYLDVRERPANLRSEDKIEFKCPFTKVHKCPFYNGVDLWNSVWNMEGVIPPVDLYCFIFYVCILFSVLCTFFSLFFPQIEFK